MKKLAYEFDRIGYDIQPMTMKATDFGVPQIRERVFIIGIRKGENIAWEFPEGDGPEYSISKNIMKVLKNRGLK